MNEILHLPDHLSECNNPAEYEQLCPVFKGFLQKWIEKRVRPHLIKSYNPSLSSYVLKHYFEKENGLYITNGTLKGAMLEAGILPLRYNDKNWVFKVGKKFNQ